MKTFVVGVFCVLLVTLTVAEEKNTNWQWKEDDKPLADFGRDATVTALTVCPDGTVIAVAHDDAACKLYAITEGAKKTFEVPSDRDLVRFIRLRLNPEGTKLYATDVPSRSVFAWSLADQRLVSPQPVETDAFALAMVTLQDSTSASSTSLLALDQVSKSLVRKGTVRIKSMPAGVEQEVTVGGEIRDIAFAPPFRRKESDTKQESYLVVLMWECKQSSGGNYGPYFVCVVGPRKPGQAWEVLDRHPIPGAPYEVAVSPKDPMKVAVATSSGLVVVDVRSRKTTQVGPRDRIDHVVFLPDGTLVSDTENGENGMIRIWEIGKMKPLAQLGKKGPVISALAAGNSYSTEIVAAVNGRVLRFKRQRPEGEPVPVSDK